VQRAGIETSFQKNFFAAQTVIGRHASRLAFICLSLHGTPIATRFSTIRFRAIGAPNAR
jgi:hypothetical protein